MIPRGMALKQNGSPFYYMVSWPLAAPQDGYREFRKYSPLVGIIGFLLGIPLIAVRFLRGIGMAAASLTRP